MSSSVPQSSFTAGEIAPSLYGRVDFAKYYSGLKTCRNFIVRPFGGASNRPGSKYLGCAIDSTKAIRLIPFQFSTQQTYVLEFGDYTMRIIKEGAYVVYPVGHGSAGQVVSITTIYPAGDLEYLYYAQTADVMTICHPDYPVYQLRRYDHHDFRFSTYNNVLGPFETINIDTSLTIKANAVTGNVTLTASSSLFTSSMVGRMIYLEQSADALTKKWEVAKTVTINDFKRAGSNYYQAADTGTTGTVRPDHTEGVGYDGDPGVAWTFLHSGFGIVRITGFTSATVVTGVVLKRLPESLITASSVKNITGAVSGDPDGTPASGDEIVTVTCIAHGFSNGDSVTIASVGGMTALNGTWQVTVIDANRFSVSLETAGLYTTGGTATRSLTAQPSYKWALEAWGGENLYPSIVSYFQQRQVFGNTFAEPQTLWFSVTTGYENFETNNPGLDTDAITFTTATREVNEIRHFVELSQLIMLTSSGEWLVTGDQNGTIAPSNISVKRQGFSGSSRLIPVIVGSQALYIQEKGSQVRALAYNLQSDAFVGSDLTVLANHLFYNKTIVNWCYQRMPFQTIWAVRDDGVLLGLSYMPEHEVAAWHRHDTDGLYEDVCCISEGQDDAVYCVVNRDGVRCIERFDTRRFTSLEDAFFVDSGLSYSGSPATVFSGLSHLEGKTVSILADGFVVGQQVVTGGQITLEDAASTVHVGLPIEADLGTLPIASTQQNIRDKQKLIHRVSILCEESLGIKVGKDADNLVEIKQRTTENYTEPTALKTGLVDVRIPANWNKDGEVYIRQDQPIPITILSIMPEVTVAGS